MPSNSSSPSEYCACPIITTVRREFSYCARCIRLLSRSLFSLSKNRWYYDRGQAQAGDFGSHLSRSMWFLVRSVRCTVTKNSIKEDVKRTDGGGKKQIALQFRPRYCLELKEVETGSAYRPIKIPANSLTYNAHSFCFSK